MDLRDLVKLAGLADVELLNRLEPSVEEEAEGAGFDRATTEPEEEIFDDPMASAGSDADLSLRRYLKARGDHVTVDEDVYPDYTVEDVNEAYAAFKESKERPYVCVHAKKGTYECTAGSSYEAAKKAAEHWKLKSTAGIDAYLADVKHTPTESVTLAKVDERRFTRVDYKKHGKTFADLRKQARAKAASEMSKEQFAKAYPDFAEDYEKLRKQQMADVKEGNMEPEGTFVGINTETGDFESGLSYEEVTSGRFTHMLPDDTTYFDPDTASELVGAPDEEMEAMGWEKVPANENAFNQAAADAARAGKKEFKFNGKTYPVKMDKETAHKLDEGDMMSAADELEAYARENGGIDADDFMTAVAMMRKGEHFKLNKFVDELDTEPREKILSIVQKHLGEGTLEEAAHKLDDDVDMLRKLAGLA